MRVCERSPKILAAAANTGLGVVKSHAYGSVSELLSLARTLPRSEEGFVVRFESGLRLKIKGDEYKRIHALISGLTPLAMWQAMANQMDMQDIRRDLPEEFWDDFDLMTAILEANAARIVAKVEAAAHDLAPLSDKEIGLRLASLDPDVKPLIFEYRKSGRQMFDGRMREKLFRMIRPTGNALPGYSPSHAIARVADDPG